MKQAGLKFSMGDPAMGEVRNLDERRHKGAKCPNCARLTVAEFRPFCSVCCKTIDLGRWLGGDYRIPSEEEPDEADLMEIARNLDQDRERSD
jgi:endogenous inhibitor of DNA gyrase (YacG/DUF329 family)